MNRVYLDELNQFIRDVDLSELTGKSILISGASGLIGSYLVDVILQNNEQKGSTTKVFALSRNIDYSKKRFKEYSSNPFLKIIKQDITEPLNVSFDCNYIIHAASSATPKAFDEDPIGTIKANVIGTLNLLELARDNKAKLLYISSSEVYGEPLEKDAILSESSLGLVDQMNPRSCYTESKRLAENICLNYFKQYRVQNTIARVCFVYGPTFSENDNRVIPQFLRRALNDENIIMKSTGELRRSYAYIYDVASGLFRILFNGDNGAVYNVSNSRSNVSIREIAEIIAQITGVQIGFDLPETKTTSGYSPFSSAILDSSKLERMGWRPLFDMKEGMARTLQILRYHGGKLC